MPAPAAHPAANIFPMMDEDALDELAQDIKENGLLEPILLYQGTVIDGRNRLLACRRADIAPTYKDVGELSSPIMFVVSKNLHRRHLTVGQRATIAVEMIPLLRDEAKERQRFHGGTAPGKTSVINDKNTCCISAASVSRRSAEEAADALGVSVRTVYSAAMVQREDPEIFAQVKDGAVSVTSAVQQVKEPAPRPIIANNKARDSANAHARRMAIGLSTIEGCCHGLAQIDVGPVIAVSGDEIPAWIEKANMCAKALRAFAHKLEEAFNG